MTGWRQRCGPSGVSGRRGGWCGRTVQQIDAATSDLQVHVDDVEEGVLIGVDQPRKYMQRIIPTPPLAARCPSAGGILAEWPTTCRIRGWMTTAMTRATSRWFPTSSG